MVGRFQINTPLQPSADASVDLEPSLTPVPSEAGSLIRRHIPHPEELTLSILVEIRSHASQSRIEFDLIIIHPPSYLPAPCLRVRNFISTQPECADGGDNRACVVVSGIAGGVDARYKDGVSQNRYKPE